jgi:hypothetical protein
MDERLRGDERMRALDGFHNQPRDWTKCLEGRSALHDGLAGPLGTCSFAAALMALGLLSGCAERPPKSPRPAAESFARAALADDAEAMHAMLTQAGQDQYTLAEVRALMKYGRSELRATAEGLLADPKQCSEGVAYVRLSGNAEELVLTETPSGYRISRAFGVTPPAATPELLLQDLAEALRALDLPALLALLSSDRRADWLEKVSRLADEIRESGPIHIEPSVSGFIVTLAWGTRIEVAVEAEGYKVIQIQ